MSSSGEPYSRRILERFKPGGIGRHISWLLLHSGSEAVTMTLATLLAARWMGPIAWGQLGILLTGAQLVSMVADGFYGTIIKVVSEERARENAGVAQLASRLVWLTTLILLGLSVLVEAATYVWFPDKLQGGWVLAGVLVAASRGWRTAYDGAYRGFQEFSLPALAGIVCTSGTAGAIIALTAAGHGVGAYLTVMAAGLIVNCLWLAAAFYFKVRPRVGGQQTRETPWKIEKFIRYSVPLAWRGAVGFLFLKINIWMLAALSTDFDAGQFRLTDQFLTIPALLLSAVLAAIAPRVPAAALEGREALERLAGRVNGLMLGLSIPLALFFWFNGPILQRIFPSYVLSSEMLAYFAPSMLVMGIGYSASIFLIQGGQPGAAFLITLVSGVANVAFAWLGFRWGGVKGLALGTGVVHFTSYVVTVLVTNRLFRIPFQVRLH